MDEQYEIDEVKRRLGLALSDEDKDNPIVQFTVKKNLFIKMAIAYLSQKL